MDTFLLIFDLILAIVFYPLFLVSLIWTPFIIYEVFVYLFQNNNDKLLTPFDLLKNFLWSEGLVNRESHKRIKMYGIAYFIFTMYNCTLDMFSIINNSIYFSIWLLITGIATLLGVITTKDIYPIIETDETNSYGNSEDEDDYDLPF